MINLENTIVKDDGLLYCSKCGEAKEELLPTEAQIFLGKAKRNRQCACDRMQVELFAKEQSRREKAQLVKTLRNQCFDYEGLIRYTFENAFLDNLQLKKGMNFVKHWDEWKNRKGGLLFWGDVGSGKTYMAASIANELLNQEVSVRMISLSQVLNAPYEARNDLIQSLARISLLIIDDFGSERSTEYGLELIHNVIDARCCSDKPMIITTNLSLRELKNPPDVIHKKIYDRVMLCTPVHFSNESYRLIESKENMEFFKRMLQSDIESL